MNKFLIFGFGSLFLLFFSSVHAQIFTYDLGNIPGISLDVNRFFSFLESFACWFLRFGIIVIAVMIIVYGIMFLKSRGAPQGMGVAKKALTWGLVGGLVIFGVFTIILSVAKLIGVEYPILTYINCG